MNTGSPVVWRSGRLMYVCRWCRRGVDRCVNIAGTIFTSGHILVHPRLGLLTGRPPQARATLWSTTPSSSQVERTRTPGMLDSCLGSGLARCFSAPVGDLCIPERLASISGRPKATVICAVMDHQASWPGKGLVSHDLVEMRWTRERLTGVDCALSIIPTPYFLSLPAQYFRYHGCSFGIDRLSH